jgi:DNA replication protein DnaC
MIIIYCENCGTRMKVERVEGLALCDECKAGKKIRRRIRDSGQIPRKKFEQFRAMGKPETPKNDR